MKDADCTKENIKIDSKLETCILPGENPPKS